MYTRGMDIDVTLEWYEYHMASEVGRLRKFSHIEHNRQNNHGFAGPGWNEDIEGACAEMATAKALGIYWSGSVGSFKHPDLGNNLQVRSTISHNYSLIVRPADHDEDLYILVTGMCPDYKVRGYISGAEAKNDLWKRGPVDRPDAYFVPIEALRPMSDLMFNAKVV